MSNIYIHYVLNNLDELEKNVYSWYLYIIVVFIIIGHILYELLVILNIKLIFFILTRHNIFYYCILNIEN